MRRFSLSLLVVFLLACTGLTEFLEEQPLEERVTERADGVDVELPNGNGIHVFWGEAITHPAQLRLPAPPDGLLVSWAEVDLPLLQPAFLAVYGTLSPKKETLAFYRQALEARGVTVERKKDQETGSVALYGQDGDRHLAAVVHPDGGVLLAAGPEQAVNFGLQYAETDQERRPRAWKGDRGKAKAKGKRTRP